MKTTEALKLPENIGDLSDGYHTFNELYEHRIELWIALCKFYYNLNYTNENTPNVWRSKFHHDGSSFDGWFILGIFKSYGNQITYHLPLSKWDDVGFAETLEFAPEWDKHSSQDVLERLKAL